MNEEMNSLYKNCIYQLVKRPKNKMIVACKWIYIIKERITITEPRRFKVNLVAKGYI